MGCNQQLKIQSRNHELEALHEIGAWNEIGTRHKIGARMSRTPTAQIRCVVARAGTSRFVVVLGPECDRLGLSTKELSTSLQAAGLLGTHYQAAKILELGELHGRDTLPYVFHQVMSDGQVVSGLECGHGAAAARAAALAWGTVNEASGDMINIGTGQRTTIAPADGDTQRLEFDASWPPVGFYSGPAPLWFQKENVRFPFWIMERGNAFCLARVDPSTVEEDTLKSLDHMVRQYYLDHGGDYHRARLPKLILFQSDVRTGNRTTAMAGCWSNGERHHSLPCSGSMVLTSFLASLQLLEEPPEERAGAYHFDLQHPSGWQPVRVDWETEDGERCITACAVETAVRVLFSGQLEVASPEEPRRAASAVVR
jgi:hypothetical protein